MQDHQTHLAPIWGVPQRQRIGPATLHDIYSRSTFADNTVIIAWHKNPQPASNLLQPASLRHPDIWLSPNVLKFTHVTFTLNRETCPPVCIKQPNTTIRRHKIPWNAPRSSPHLEETYIKEAARTRLQEDAETRNLV